jgi:phosphate:Na+ symporter
MRLMSAVNALENIGDIIETDNIHSGNWRLASNLRISKQTEKVLSRLHELITTIIDSASIHQIDRLRVNEPDCLAQYTIEKFKRIYYSARRMARLVMPANLGSEQIHTE